MSITKINHVFILGIPVKVEFVEDIPDPVSFIDGTFNEATKVITIKLQSESQMIETFIHEILHATLYLSGISQLMLAELNEAICHALTNSIIQVLKVDLKSSRLT